VPDAAQAETDLAKLAKSMVILASSAVGGGAAATATSSLLAPLEAVDVKWRLPLGRSKKLLDDQTEEVQTLLTAANILINDIRHQLGRTVLLVLDGLDRIENRDDANALFGDSAILAHIQCNSVIGAPFVLRHDTRLATVRGFEVKILVNEPVLAHDDPSKPGPGIDFMLDVFRRRTHDLASPIDEAIVRELAYRSGGRLRDFIKLVRELAGQVLLRGAETASGADLDTALREQRLLLEAGLNTEHIAALRSVMDDPRHRLPPGTIGYELLRTNRLLPYPDGSEWYYPHALLTKGDLLKGASRAATNGSAASSSISSSGPKESSCSWIARATRSSAIWSVRF
jgi:hypothetical protein